MFFLLLLNIARLIKPKNWLVCLSIFSLELIFKL